MFKYSKDGISVLLTLDTRREKKNGLYPVKIQVVKNRKQKYYTTGKSLSEDEWQKLPQTRNHKLSAIRNDLENSFSIIKTNVEFLVHENKFTFDALSIRLGRGLSRTINDAFNVKIESLLNEERIGTYHYYKDTLKAIERFAGKNIPFSSLSVDWLKKFENHLLKNGKNYTTIGMRCRAIRAIINDAIEMGIVREDQYPFGRGKYEIPIGQGRKLALTLAQIKSLVTYTDGLKGTEHSRDLWFFSYLCNGINFADIVTLKYADIHNGEIYFSRSKTIRTAKKKKRSVQLLHRRCRILLIDGVILIKKTESYIFGFLNGDETSIQIKNKTRDIISRCNKQLKKIGKAIGLEGLSTYTARHSFATVLKRSGTNIAYISESLGHSNLKTTENYLASFERDERERNAKLLTNFDG